MDYIKKTFFFIGDSIFTGGFYLDYLREYFDRNNIAVNLYNKGVPGFRADLFQMLADEDLNNTKCDYGVINYGVNDIGVWLYDERIEVNERLIKKRNERIERYVSAIKNDIDILRRKGIIPILTSPLVVNENLIERISVETIRDNKEKEDEIDDGFYKKETFRRINQGLKVMRDKVELLAQKEGLEFWDLNNDSAKNVAMDSFIDDGIHYTKKGHFIIASSILKNMTGEKLVEYPISDYIEKMREDENIARNYYFVKYNVLFFEFNKILDTDEVYKIACERKDKECFIKTKQYIESINGIQIQPIKTNNEIEVI